MLVLPIRLHMLSVLIYYKDNCKLFFFFNFKWNCHLARQKHGLPILPVCFREWEENAYEKQIYFVLYTASCFTKIKFDFETVSSCNWCGWHIGKVLWLTFVSDPVIGLRKPDFSKKNQEHSIYWVKEKKHLRSSSKQIYSFIKYQAVEVFVFRW